MKTMLLIDAFAVIHRAFHALPDFATPDGTHVNAVYGFFSTLLKASKEINPDYMVVGFDSPGPTLRHKKFQDYKAQRPETPPTLSEQVPLVKELVEALQVPLLIHEGYEAEDLLATVITKTANRNLQYVLVTGDQDTLQLANSRVKIYFLRRGLADTELVDGQKVKELFGVSPWQIIDVKALAGDPSDNIPGISGIGEKTAVDLVQKYESVEGIYRHLDQLPERQRHLLEGGKEQALANKLLVTIRLDAPVNISLAESAWKGENFLRAIPILEKYNMKSLIKRINGSLAVTKQDSSPAPTQGSFL